MVVKLAPARQRGGAARFFLLRSPPAPVVAGVARRVGMHCYYNCALSWVRVRVSCASVTELVSDLLHDCAIADRDERDIRTCCCSLRVGIAIVAVATGRVRLTTTHSMARDCLPRRRNRITTQWSQARELSADTPPEAPTAASSTCTYTRESPRRNEQESKAAATKLT